MKIKFLNSALACLLISATFLMNIANAGLMYDEVTDGELSAFIASPTALTFDVGANTINGTVGGDGASQGGLGWDVFSFSLASNQMLSSVIVDIYSSATNSTVFNLLKLPISDTLTSVAFDETDIGSNIFTSSAFTLDILNFQVEIKEFGASVNYQLTFNVTQLAASASQIPEPSTIAIFALGLLGLVSRRLQQ